MDLVYGLALAHVTAAIRVHQLDVEQVMSTTLFVNFDFWIKGITRINMIVFKIDRGQ